MKQWVHRHNAKAENLFVEQVQDPYRPGQVQMTLSYRTEGTKLVKVDHVTVRMDVHQVIRLVEQTRKVLDDQIQRLQGQRSRLG